MRVLFSTLVCVSLAATTILAGERVEAPPERAFSAFSEDPARRFDFWIGRWDVNLRMQQEDLSFRDSVKADTHIYPVLDGKAILELWDSQPIKGYSLRYYDPAKQTWVLWLNWPGKNRSNHSSLEGEFRHGRGRFRSTYTDADGNEVIQRYAFNDITPFSLRWDDLSSADGGKTWRKNWVMEFSRTQVDPAWPIPRDAVPTFVDGRRCDDERFRPYEAVVGSWQGEGATLEAYRVLDGCAVMGFLEQDGKPDEFLMLTYLTGPGVWETSVLDARRETPLARYQGESWTELSLDNAGTSPLHWKVTEQRLEYQRAGTTVVLTPKK